jgi:hypothetical protein
MFLSTECFLLNVECFSCGLEVRFVCLWQETRIRNRIWSALKLMRIRNTDILMAIVFGWDSEPEWFERSDPDPKTQHWSVLYCTVLYCTVLYCTVLYCTVPRWNSWATFFEEVSGHKLESSQTRVFVHSTKCYTWIDLSFRVSRIFLWGFLETREKYCFFNSPVEGSVNSMEQKTQLFC